MSIKELQEKLRAGVVTFCGNCHDCGAPVEILCNINENGEIVISGGAVYDLVINGNKQLFLKCDNCYHKDSVLRSWRECSVYSRVVGYLRPVSDWNKGKQEEWKTRKNYAMPK